MFWNCENFGAAPAIVDADDRQISYATLTTWADRVVTLCPSRSLVAIRCPFSVTALAVYLGCLRGGIVPLLLDRELPDEQVAEAIERFQIAWVWEEGSGSCEDLAVTEGAAGLRGRDLVDESGVLGRTRTRTRTRDRTRGDEESSIAQETPYKVTAVRDGTEEAASTSTRTAGAEYEYERSQSSGNDKEQSSTSTSTAGAEYEYDLPGNDDHIGAPFAAGNWRATGKNSPTLHPELGLLLLTSGSTGRPRCVRLSYQNLSSNAAAIATFLQLSASDRPLLTLPWSSAFGLSVIHSHWAVGAAVVLPAGSILERNFWQQFRRQSATSLAGVPLTFAQLNRLKLERLEVPSLRQLLQAGGRLSPELVQSFADLGQRLGFRLFVMYGQTEATARMAYLDPELAGIKSTSIGRPIPGGELTVRDQTGKIQQEPGEVGELFYRGPNVMMGYADSANDLALGYQHNGQIGTGDLGYRDADGDFYVAGRLSRFVKLEGKRVHLDAIEQTLKEWGYEALAVGDDSQVTVAVRSHHKAEVALEELKQRLAAHFRVHHLWFCLQRLLAIPYLPNGKVDYWSFAARHARALHAR